MNYNVTLMSPADREEAIRKGIEEPIGHEKFYEFRNAEYELPVIRISVDLPIYRMSNFRTFTAQAEQIVKNKLKPTYFIQGQETDTVQQEQHRLLAELAKKGIAESVVPISDVLTSDGQREPILISSTGVVVNGNRRLAAMRELFADPVADYPNFSHVNCMVLPSDATAREILEIEANLQGKPETKLDYDWIGDGQLIKALVDSDHSIPDIAKRLHRSENDIRNALQAIVEADIYLRDWAKADDEYGRIRDDAEQLFKDLPKLLKGKSPGLQEASRAIAWSLFENREKLSGRLYDYNAAIGRLADDVLDRLTKSSEYPKVKTTGADTDQGFDVAIDIDGAESSDNYVGIVAALRDDTVKEAAVDVLIEACSTAIETERGQKSGEAALRTLTQVHSKLAGIDLSKASTETYVGVEKQLMAIGDLTAKFLKQMKKLNNK